MRLDHKLRAVVRHEFLTIIRQPSFWISLFAIPSLLALIMAISYFTGTDDNKAIDKSQSLSIVVIDESSSIDQTKGKPYGVKFADSDQQTQLQKDVVAGKLDGLVVYPQNLAQSGVYKVFANNTDRDNGAIVEEVGKTLLQQSLLSGLDDNKARLALNGGQSDVETFTNGKPSRDFSEMVVPGAFLVVFYIVLVFSVGYALTSIAEEKENRSIEMVLSYIKPRTLIRGKLLAIILVTVVQITIIAIFALIAYFIARALGNNLALPFSISDLSFVPFEIIIGTGFLLFGFVFYVALMAMIGAIFPSSKEASGFSTVFFFLPAIPFWGISTITSQASSTFTQVLTYFPLTSPTTVLIRNASGNLTTVEGVISLAILMVSTVLVIFLAAKAFRLGTLEYTNRIKLRSLLK